MLVLHPDVRIKNYAVQRTVCLLRKNLSGQCRLPIDHVLFVFRIETIPSSISRENTSSRNALKLIEKKDNTDTHRIHEDNNMETISAKRYFRFSHFSSETP